MTELDVVIGERHLHMDYDNTLIRLFSNVMLNHTYHEPKDDGRYIVIFGGELLDTLYDEGFPQYSRSDNPDWAVQLLIDNDSSKQFDIEL